MKIIDVNILLYAVNENSDPHIRIRQWISYDKVVNIPPLNLY